MTLEAFKLLFAERPDAPEGVEFWEWVANRGEPIPLSAGIPADVDLWRQSGPPARVELWIPDGRRIVYFRDREGALTA